MSEFTKQTTEATEQYLGFLARAQEQFLDFAKSSAELAVPAPAVAVPAEVQNFAASFPTPREVSDAYFSFTERLTAQQRSFVEQYFAIADGKVKATQAEAKKKA